MSVDNFHYFVARLVVALPRHDLNTIADLDAQFRFSDLCLNPDKFDAILLGTHQHLLSFPTVPNVNIAPSPVTVSDQVTTLDKYFTFDLIFLHFARNIFSSLCPEAHMFLSYNFMRAWLHP